MIMGAAGFLSWIYLNVLMREFFMLRGIIGLGYGMCFGCAMVHWYQDLRKYGKWERDEKIWDNWREKISPFRCPDCGMISHNPNDAKYSFCGFCQAFKR